MGGAHMKPNFDQVLKIKNDRRTIEAGGPCNWDPDDRSAEIKDVMVEQPGVIASSGTTSTTVQRGDDSWWLDATSSRQFATGPARVHAVAFVTKTDGTVQEYPWPDYVELGETSGQYAGS
jgi:hypothetical protein